MPSTTWRVTVARTGPSSKWDFKKDHFPRAFCLKMDAVAAAKDALAKGGEGIIIWRKEGKRHYWTWKFVEEVK